jgi:hypothetical protein
LVNKMEKQNRKCGLLFACGTRGWTQGFVLARQVLCHFLAWFYASLYSWDDRHEPLHSAISWNGVLWTFCLGQPWVMIFPIFASQVLGLQVWSTTLSL